MTERQCSADNLQTTLLGLGGGTINVSASGRRRRRRSSPICLELNPLWRAVQMCVFVPGNPLMARADVVPHLDGDSSGVHRRRPAKELSGGCKLCTFATQIRAGGELVAPKVRAVASKAAVPTTRPSFQA